MLNITNAPNPVLSQKAKRVNKVDKAILGLIEEMKETLLSARDPVGVGLAAPQVGRSLQIFIAKPSPKSKIQVFINPIILKIPKDQARGDASGGVQRSASSFAASARLEGAPLDERAAGPRAKKTNSTKLEGCLSLKDTWGEVKRHPGVNLSYQDEKGKIHSQKFSGFMATIIQHEYDHLNGILFPKRVLEQKGKLYKSHKDEKGKDIFEEIEI